MCAADAADPAVTNPRRGRPPAGYTRLGQGPTAWDCAEFLTQLTGRQAAVRRFADSPHSLGGSGGYGVAS
ncbi:MAG: hypothetical protein ACM3ML_12670 [Micromonosporaceae bacterium]